MLGVLRLECDNQWYVHWNNYCTVQMIDESIDTSYFKSGSLIEFEIKLASHEVFTINSSNKHRAFPLRFILN